MERVSRLANERDANRPRLGIAISSSLITSQHQTVNRASSVSGSTDAKPKAKSLSAQRISPFNAVYSLQTS